MAVCGIMLLVGFILAPGPDLDSSASPPDPKIHAGSLCLDALGNGVDTLYTGVFYDEDETPDGNGGYNVIIDRQIKSSETCPIEITGGCSVKGETATVTQPYQENGYIPC